MIPGALSQIVVGANGDVWGLNSDNRVYGFNGSTQSWTWIAGTLIEISAGADGDVWGLNAENQLYAFKPARRVGS